MISFETLHEIKKYTLLLIKAKKDLDKSSERRFKLGFTATRKQITTANAKYQTDAEHYNKMYWKLKTLSENI